MGIGCALYVGVLDVVMVSRGLDIWIGVFQTELEYDRRKVLKPKY